MSSASLTDREQEYLSCETPKITRPEIVRGLTTGFLIGLVQAAFTPGADRGDSRIIRTERLMRYTRFKTAAEHKRDGCLTEKDRKTLKKLNSEPFILDTEDPDAFIRKVYEDRMNKEKELHPESSGD